MADFTDTEIDEQYRHLVEDLEWDPAEPRDWTFSFVAPDQDRLHAFAESLGEDYIAEMMPVEVMNEDGELIESRINLNVIARGAYEPDELKRIRDELIERSKPFGAAIEDLTAWEVMDEDALEEMFGWLPLEDAQWRLSYFHSLGQVAEGEAMAFEFAIEAESAAALEQLAETLAAKSFISEIVEDEEGPVLLARIEGVNDRSLLAEKFKVVEGFVAQTEANLLGVQFPADDAGLDSDESE